VKLRLAFFLIPSVVFGAGTWTSAKYGGSFLETGVGARSLAMGSAFTALANDVTAIYWNPACLNALEVPQILGMHSEQFSGVINLDFAAAGFKSGPKHAFGIGFLRLGVDGIPFTSLRDPSRGLGEIIVDEDGNRFRNDPVVSRFVNDSEMAVFFTASSQLREFWVGGTAKVIRKSAGGYGAWGMGFDFGFLWMPGKRYRLGIRLGDITATWMAWSGGRKEVILPHGRLGFAALFKKSSFTLTPACDMDITIENRGEAAQAHFGTVGLDFYSGMEIGYRDRLAFRFGLDRGNLTLGGGFRFSLFRFDYAFCSHWDLGKTHRISMSVDWDPKRIKDLI
jgi:hypothetical protein